MQSVLIKISLVISFVFSSIAIQAQDIIVGNKVGLYSEILDEERELWVSLPRSYHDSLYVQSSYPVLYLLDPDYHFFSMVAVREALTGGLYNYMPEMIIVGITNTDRSRDLTPTNSAVIHSGKKIHTTSGGADNFLSFIENELIPFVDSKYRTNNYRILNGHSFGGLFTLYALQERPSCFNAYIVHDPSIWWDDMTLYKSAFKKQNSLNLNGKCLYLSMAFNQEQQKDRFRHSQSILEYKEGILGAFKERGLRYKFEYFSNEDHGTIFLPACYNALRYIYQGICLPVKEIPGNPDILTKHYNSVSDSLHFKLVPSEKLVKGIADYCLLRQEIESAEKLLQLNIQNYPKSAYAYLNLGKLYLKMNKADMAAEQFQLAKSLDATIVIPTLSEKLNNNQ